jgi:hypothetical protein
MRGVETCAGACVVPRHQHPVLSAPHHRFRWGQEWHCCREGGGGGCDHNSVFTAWIVSGTDLTVEPDASASLVLSTLSSPCILWLLMSPISSRFLGVTSVSSTTPQKLFQSSSQSPRSFTTRAWTCSPTGRATRCWAGRSRWSSTKR